MEGRDEEWSMFWCKLTNATAVSSCHVLRREIKRADLVT